jgi:hypothetical protein
VDTSRLEAMRKSKNNEECESFSVVVDVCAKVTMEEISDIGCMSHVQSTGEICASYDKNQTSCIVNNDCDLVDTSSL